MLQNPNIEKTPPPQEQDDGGDKGNDGNGGSDGSEEGEQYIIDYSCSVDDDCSVKNVGNCCGYYPKCVNVNFEPDPSKACPGTGMAGICGWSEISRCTCDSAGKCQGVFDGNDDEEDGPV